ncbi:MAG: nucleoside triphosphate pyrophosphohydrolase [Pseudomonadota bacterium]
MQTINKLLEIMATLRNPQSGCPWDLEQTFDTIAPYTVEEAYEVADAIARGALDELKGELGDLLFQVVFHARMAEEAGQFAFNDVVAAIVDKLERRHPHVFGSEEERERGAEAGSWERIKAAERAAGKTAATVSALDDVPLALPALTRAVKLGKRASGVGFDWPDVTGVRAKVDEELAELDDAAAATDTDAVREELGDLLFSVANLARHLGIDAEQALVGANAKFEKRFRGMERAAVEDGICLNGLSVEALEALWERQKSN